jgi:hypothetical protein
MSADIHMRRRERSLVSRVQRLLDQACAHPLHDPARTSAIELALEYEEQLRSLRERLKRFEAIDDRRAFATLLARTPSGRSGHRRHDRCTRPGCRPVANLVAAPWRAGGALSMAGLVERMELARLSTEAVITRARIRTERTRLLVAQSLQRLSR